MSSEIEISDNLSIPASELWFTASRSSGPGDQNVNKFNTRVTLWFYVANSYSLSDRQKLLKQNHLPTRINKLGVFRVVSPKFRSQATNRDAAIERFVLLLREPLQEVSPRKNTKISATSKHRRLA